MKRKAAQILVILIISTSCYNKSKGLNEKNEIQTQIDRELSHVETRADEMSIKSGLLDFYKIELESAKLVSNPTERAYKVELIKEDIVSLIDYSKDVQYFDSLSFVKIDSLQNLL